MSIRKPIVLLGVVMFVLVLLLPLVSAQSTLVPNEKRENETMSGRTSFAYEPVLYSAELTSGHWTVLVETDFDLKIKITVATNSTMTDVIAGNASERGHYPEVDFTIDHDDTVYILVEENSVYGDSSGFYDIGVYDDEHVPATGTTDIWPYTSTTPSPSGNNMLLIFGIVSIVSIVAVGILGSVWYLRKPKPDWSVGQVVSAPSAAIPEQHRSEVDEGLRTVRIPTECPKCGASLSTESIEWIGALEAKCTYCGTTVHAKFEKV